MKTILSCDGGGIRGLLTAVLLADLEKRLQQQENDPNKRLKDYFDIIAGTSTGSILACGVARGISAQEMKEFYESKGIEIFPKFKDVFPSIWERIFSLMTDDINEALRVLIKEFNIFDLLSNLTNLDTKKFASQPIYDGKGLESVLKEVFGENTKFKDLNLPLLTIITSYDVYNRRSVIFKNNELHFQDIPVWEICRSSSAAPVAFPAHLLKNETYLSHLTNNPEPDIKIPPEGIPLVDGGVVANNPALCAIAECQKKLKELPTLVASFGTGSSLNRITVREAKNWGAFNWASLIRNIPLMDVFSDGSSDAVDYIATQMVEDDNYFRFQPRFKENDDPQSFSANGDNLKKLTKTAEDFIKIKENNDKINTLVKRLIEER